MIRAGASSVVPPYQVGVLRLVSELVRPHVVSFLDAMLKSKQKLRMEEIVVSEGSWAVDKELRALHFPEKFGLQIIAMKSAKTALYNYFPKAADRIEKDMVMVTIGTPDKIKKLKDRIYK